MKPRPPAICRLLPLLTLWALPAAAAPIVPDPAGASPLGTLFFSAAERDAVVAARRGETIDPALPSGSGWGYQPGGGKRGRLRGTAWINGQPLPEGQAMDGGGVPGLQPKQVTVGGRTVRVGESVNLESGTRADLVPDGSLRMREGK